MSAPTRVAGSMLDKAIFGRDSEKSLDEMSDEELEARFVVMRERASLAGWGGFAAGLAGGAFGGAKLAALLFL